jgi:hypothetical protein
MLIEMNGKEEVVKWFNYIDSKFSLKQKETVDFAFMEAGCDPVYKHG